MAHSVIFPSAIPQATSRKSYATLDAMRGLAAVMVVGYHAPDMFGPLFAGGWLAVDLFFCLSGFVIAHAYGPKMENGTLRFTSFMWIRLMRLYPLFLLSIAFSVAMMFAATIGGHGTMANARSIAPSILFLPTPFAVTLYPLNLPAWSLFMELIINVVAVSCWQWLTNRNLAIIVGLSGILLIVIMVPLGFVGGGDTWNGFHLGIARVTFSFFAGVGIHRARNLKIPRISPIILLAALFVALTIGQEIGVFGRLFIVVAGFPALVAAGAAVEPQWARPSALLGRLSYGVYILHVPALALARPIENRLTKPPMAPYNGIIFLLCLLAGCWLADRYFDKPVRRWLLRKSVKTRTPGPEQTAF